jgi:hypothetical protein
MPGRDFVVPGILVCSTSLMLGTPCCGDCFVAAPILGTTSCLGLDFKARKTADTPLLNVSRGLLVCAAPVPPWAGRLRRNTAGIMVPDGVRADAPVGTKGSRCDVLSSTSGVAVTVHVGYCTRGGERWLDWMGFSMFEVLGDISQVDEWRLGLMSVCMRTLEEMQ